VAIDNHQLTILNLILSCFAAMQGAIILLAAKRADAVAAEQAVAHYAETTKLDQLLVANNAMTTAIKDSTDLLQEIHRHVSAITPDAGEFPPPPAGS
jgi:uncharacterized membrane protein